MIEGVEKISIGNLFSRGTPCRVPKYQRSYDWDDEHIDDFINDLHALYVARSSDGHQLTDHFFGGLVNIDEFAANTVTGRIYEVIDGQQRLATFTIAISLIIKELEALSQKADEVSNNILKREISGHIEQIKRNFLLYDEVSGELRQRLRLTLSRTDNLFFEGLITNNPTSASRPSHRKLLSAHQRIQDKLFKDLILERNEDLPLDECLARILRLRTCVTNDCYVIHIVSNDRQEAYRLFLVLNDRGKNLSDGDLLRSRTLELLESFENIQVQVEEYWDRILEKESDDVSNFFRSYYPSHKGERAPQRDLFGSLCQAFFNYEARSLDSIDDAWQVERRVGNLKSEAELYYMIASARWPFEDGNASSWQRDRLFRLVKILKHKLCFPLLISASSVLLEVDFSEIVNLLERFVFRYINIVGAHATPLSNLYYKHASLIRDMQTDYNIQLLECDLRDLQNRKALNDDFVFNLKKLKYSRSSSDKRLIKHFLTTVEDFYSWYENGANGKPIANAIHSFDIDQITLEHIYPNNARPDDIDDELEYVKNDLGNLTFWASSDNRAQGSNSHFGNSTTIGQDL